MKVKDIEWETQFDYGGEYMVTYDSNEERLSVGNFMSDHILGVETAYFDGVLLWIAKGYDVRGYPESTIEEAIAFVKRFATPCVGE